MVGVAGVVGAVGVARADSFGGFAGNEKSYVLGREKVCVPLAAKDGAARGMPSCRAATTEDIASLSLKTPPPQRGADVEVRAAAKGRVVTVSTRAGDVVVTWESLDPVTGVVDVWRSTYGRIVAVEYTVRRGGHEVHEVVAFDVGVGGKGAAGGGGDGSSTDGSSGASAGGAGGAAVAPPPEDPALTKAIGKARKARGKAAVAAWGKVLELDGEHAEARYGMASAYVSTKKHDDAIASLETLAASKRADAVEWLVEARFDKVFRKLVANPRFRKAVGLDRPAATPYERLMGMGGEWEQSLTPCDRPEIKVTIRRDRSFRLAFRSVCSGQREGFSLRGTWRQQDFAVELLLPKPGGGVDVAPCLLGRDGGEDTLTCQVDADLSFEGRPVRR
jgi:hypothetical protein